MSETPPTIPLDLSAIEGLDTASTPSAAPVTSPATQPSTSVVVSHDSALDPRLAPQPPGPRLVEVSKLSVEDLEAAKHSAGAIDFRKTGTLLAHGDGVLAVIAQASRQLMSGVRVGDTGEVGQIAATVIDGVKILRIQDLQTEAKGGQAPARHGLVGKLIGLAADAHTALKGFQENRKKFLDLMDGEQAKARKTKADLTVTIGLLDQQAIAIRQSLHQLKIEIAAGQIALDRGEDELEALRQHAVATGDPADAADVLEFRGAIANFRGKIAEMRESLVGSAMLIPIIGQTKQATETRLMKISNGMLVVIPRLMAVASQAIVQVQVRHAADQAAKLDEASRQISLLAAKGAHEAATSAAQSLAGDPRNIEVLAQVADETIKTMNDVIDIERQVAAGDRAREAKLTEVRDRLIRGMQGVNQRAVEQAPRP
ncbi:MAG: toxic anion resistance protein [Steroidobacteraceae bacterium]